MKNGKQTAYTYDKLYRMVSRKDADGTATFTYDKAGNMTSAKDGNGTVSFAFDALSRTTKVTNEGQYDHGVHLRRGKQPSVHHLSRRQGRYDRV